jgi:6-pyruvoyltetrahydropterin/6-carboxytetrahydropterin synthase
MPNLRISKEFSFDAAHHLIDYHGKCENLHGHTYRLRVTVEGPVQPNGLVMDFVEIKRLVKEKVVNRLDHTNVNDTIKHSSAENIAIWSWNELKPVMPMLVEISVWETPDSYATYNGN